MATSGMQFGTMGNQMPGFGNSTSSYVPLPPQGGSQNNPTGLQGGATAKNAVPVFSTGASTGTYSAPTGGNSGASIIPSTGTATTSIPTVAPVGSGLTSFTGAATPTTSATGENNQVDTGGQQTQEQADRTLGELQQYYGEGMGSYLYNLMQTGGINLSMLNSLDTSEINALQPQINQGQANLNSTLGAQGISANSSTSALANSNYLTQATTDENAQLEQQYMQQYNEGQQLLDQIIQQTSAVNAAGTANDSSILDDIGSAIGLGSSGASLFSSLANIIPGLG